MIAVVLSSLLPSGKTMAQSIPALPEISHATAQSTTNSANPA
jgi:hypothetical protein